MSFICIRYCSYDSGGVSGDKHTVRHIFKHHCTRTNYATLSYSDTWQDIDPGTDPYIIPDRYRKSIFKPLISASGIKSMTGCVDSHVRSNKHVVTNLNFRPVKNCKIHISVEIVTDFDVIPIVTVERPFNDKVFPELPKQTD